ncbi:MAG TPA: glycerol-3-phosphate dehydrogenase/oxidase [Mycobacteriales bacterium]
MTRGDAVRSDRLGPDQRAATLAALAGGEVDVLVVGGGVTGAGVALDAAARGLSVGVLEAGDLAIGTSSRSGKTFHGGLRYLQRLDISLVRTALHERDLMVETLCPHLARPQPFLYPLLHRGWERAYVGAGVALYDALGGRLRGGPGVPRHRHLSRAAALREMPALRPDVLTGAVQYWDVRVDDARHTMTVARTAAGLGARIATRTEVTGVLRDGDRVVGVRARDRDGGGGDFEVRARVVVNAAGVWADRVAGLAGPAGLRVAPAKGVHLVVPADRIASHTGLIARTADSVLVVRPWWRHWIIGTTDTPWSGARDDPAATGGDVDYVLSETNRWLTRPLTRDDIVGVYAGLRPLLSPAGSADASETAALSRDHTVVETAPGMVTVTGGKYTTYRVMAADAVDLAARRLGGDIPASPTARLPLLGAAGWPAVRNQRDGLAAESGLPVATVDHLLDRYGSRIGDLLDLVADRPDLARPVGAGYLGAEVVYAASHEGARHLDDVLARRTHLAIETRDRGVAAAPVVAALMGEVLGWDDARVTDEVGGWVAAVDADRRSESAPDDATALAARAGRPNKTHS